MADNPPKTRPLPSQARLRDLLDYSPETGALTWKHRPGGYPPWNSFNVGREALTSLTRKGYHRGSVDGVLCQAHRVIFKWMHDEEPDQIDHVNGIRNDNRASNLVASNSSDNRKNQKLRADNKSGVNGVFLMKNGRWLAFITEGCKRKHLGIFGTIEEATAVRKSAATALGFTDRHGKTQVTAVARS
jgi:hypothetical protein